MPQPLISFIIPAYNAARYLRGCVDSVYALDLRGHEREVIVVNDGSTDKTAHLLEDISHDHPDIIIIEQENMGLSMARNVGMLSATGMYISFVDADDRLIADTSTAGLIDVLVSGRADIVGVNVKKRTLTHKTFAYERYHQPYGHIFSPARTFMQDRNIMPCVWAYLWRRGFIEENSLTFKPRIYHEDEDFTPRAFLLADTFVAVDIDWYLYIERPGSITLTTDVPLRQQKLRDMLDTMERLQHLGTFSQEWAEALDCKLNYLTVDIIRLLWRQGHTPAFRREMIRRLKAIGCFPLKWRWEKKHILFNCATRVIFSGISNKQA